MLKSITPPSPTIHDLAVPAAEEPRYLTEPEVTKLQFAPLFVERSITPSRPAAYTMFPCPNETVLMLLDVPLAAWVHTVVITSYSIHYTKLYEYGGEYCAGRARA